MMNALERIQAAPLILLLRGLNEAAYAAAKAARIAKHPMADELKAIALQTDILVDGFK